MRPNMPENLRPDLALISDWIPSEAHVLDLGCGEGALLAFLNAERDVTGYGLEIDEDEITAAVARGVNAFRATSTKACSSTPLPASTTSS